MLDFLLELSRSVNASVWGLPAMAAIIGVDLGVVWSAADTFNGLMAIPNLIALSLLSGERVEIMKERKTK